jgi:hypothetical protein
MKEWSDGIMRKTQWEEKKYSFKSFLFRLYLNQYSRTPTLQYSSIPILQYSNTPIVGF